MIVSSSRTVRPILRGGFAFVWGGLDIMKLTKTALVYSASRFNFGGHGVLFGRAKPTKAPPWRRDCRAVHEEVDELDIG